MGHLVRRRHDGTGIVGKRRHRHQDEMIAVLQPPDDLGRGLAALVLAEELFDVLDLERALLERIFRDAMLQDCLFFYRRLGESGDFFFKKKNIS